MLCQKCKRPLVTCSACGGEPSKSVLGGLSRTTCRHCNNKGKVCRDHGVQ